MKIVIGKQDEEHSNPQDPGLRDKDLEVGGWQWKGKDDRDSPNRIQLLIRTESQR